MIDRSEELVTVFGCGGFIGRHVCEFLLKAGVRVRVAQRNPRQAYVIQPLGQVGQVGYVGADIGNAASVRAALHGANAAINLGGTFGAKMRQVHVDGAANIAAAARDAGCEALIHISALGIATESASGYSRTKAEGEAAVLGAFPGATIIRPSVVFGPDDDFTNRFAGMANLPFLPVLAGTSKFQPVYVRDLGKAIALAALDPRGYAGQTFEIGGPEVMSMIELHRAILAITGQKPEVVQLPNIAGSALAALGFLPGAPLTRDQWIMLQRGSVPSGGKPGLEAFGIEPTPLATVAPEWLARFRPGGKFGGRKINLTSTN